MSPEHQFMYEKKWKKVNSITYAIKNINWRGYNEYR